MAHSLRRPVRLAFVATEIVLFGGAAVSAYLSQIQDWNKFWIVSAALVLICAVLRIAEARPELRDLLAFEDAAARMAQSAITYGVSRFYNMQKQADQNLRNADTVKEIAEADAMWLCANSGASYLDPALYRHWRAVEARLREGVPFKVVLLDPLSHEKALRDQLNVGNDAIDSKVNITNLVRIYNEHPSLEIRLVERGMHATVFASPSSLFFDPYHVGVVGQRIENRSFCLKITRISTPSEGVSYYELFKAHFDSLWRASQDFEDWIGENTAYLPKPLPIVQRRHQSRVSDAH